MVPVSVLMCHAPIVVPAVGGRRGAACAASTRAMEEAARRVVRSRPDVVLVVSPHTPRVEGAFSCAAGPRVRGDLGDFGAPAVQCDLPRADALRDALARALRADGGGAAIEDIRLRRLDHGAMVPLAFLVDAGWSGETLVIGLPADPSPAQMRALGRAIAKAADTTGLALVASGDCSHRLIPGAPAGYDPRAADFDAALVDVVTRGDDAALFSFDAQLRDVAAEDVVDTAQIAAACAEASADGSTGRKVLSYEGPFGVGYLVAILRQADGAARAETDDARGTARGLDALVDVAEDALRSHLGRADGRRSDAVHVERERFTGVFVTWRAEGELRGCVGRMRLEGSIVDAVRELAVAAATEDPRFPPVTSRELPGLTGEVTLLHPSEPVESPDELDPHVFGVEVSAGWRRGVLLPDIEGVDTVEEQLAIVLRKAGIAPHERYALRRFRAQKVIRDGARGAA